MPVRKIATSGARAPWVVALAASAGGVRAVGAIVKQLSPAIAGSHRARPVMDGVQAVQSHGGGVIVHDPMSAEAVGMRSAAMSRARFGYVLPLDEIAPAVEHIVHRQPAGP
jgi:chemotaxis response regulator CheB